MSMLAPRWKTLGLVVVLLGACDSEGDRIDAAPPQAAGLPAAQPVPRQEPVQEREADASGPPGPLDDWVGRWDGPEGTYLSISKQRDRFTLEIADLDGPKTYTALNVGDHFEFERNGTVERVRATNGKQTGMKWLEGKSNCLTIRPGEGYCRD